jgi:DNA-directed RNA polymerase specialized sigma24 family protein
MQTVNQSVPTAVRGAVATSIPLPVDAPDTRRALERLVGRLTTQRLWHEDLIQDGLVHLWELEQTRPGQSAAWYLRNCQYHLLNRMRQGRSVDSPKRRAAGYLSINGHDAPDEWPDVLLDAIITASSFEAAMARDLVSALDPWLTLEERAVMACLADGLGTCETARRLELSHTCVTRKRRHIAALIRGLAAEHLPDRSL